MGATNETAVPRMTSNYMKGPPNPRPKQRPRPKFSAGAAEQVPTTEPTTAAGMPLSFTLADLPEDVARDVVRALAVKYGVVKPDAAASSP